MGPDQFIYGVISDADRQQRRFFVYGPASGDAPRLLQKEDALPMRQVAGTRPFEPRGYQVSEARFLDAEGNIHTAGAEERTPPGGGRCRACTGPQKRGQCATGPHTPVCRAAQGCADSWQKTGKNS